MKLQRSLLRFLGGVQKSEKHLLLPIRKELLPRCENFVEYSYEKTVNNAIRIVEY
jgi:hypothetical protein